MNIETIIQTSSNLFKLFNSFLQTNILLNGNNFTEMKIKVGEIVKNAVLTSKLSKGDIVEKLGKSRTWLSNVLDNEYMPMKYILQIGNVLEVDFTKSIPELTKVIKNSKLDVAEQEVNEMSNIQLRNTVIETQSKYIALMEQYIKVLEEIKTIKK